MTTSIARTCPDCGALNRVVLLTTGLAPRWRIGCSRCGATVVSARGLAGGSADGARPAASADSASPAEPAPSAEIVQLPVPAGRPVTGPATGVTGRGRRGAAPAIRRARLPDRRWAARTRSGASTGVSFLAACGLVLALLVAEQRPAPAGAGSAGVELAAAGSAAGAAESALTAAPDETGRRDASGATNGAPVIARYRLAAALALGGREPAYPDPRAGMMEMQLAALADPEAAAAAEAGLDLSPATRREIQQRLRLAAHDPRGVDGVFGPATRAAIAAWQARSGLAPTGYVTPRALSRLIAATDAEYGAWAVAEAARRDRDRQLAAAAPMPRPQLAADDGCARGQAGEVTYGQNVRCDFRGLRENLAGLFGGRAS